MGARWLPRALQKVDNAMTFTRADWLGAFTLRLSALAGQAPSALFRFAELAWPESGHLPPFVAAELEFVLAFSE